MIHRRTQTYNFNVISRDSDPSFGVRDKPFGLGKSPGKAHLKEELIAPYLVEPKAALLSTL